MNADRHFAKAEGFERSQVKLDPTADQDLVVEGCYFAAHHYICAGSDWHGVQRPDNHAHGRNPALLKRAGAPQDVINAWAC